MKKLLFAFILLLASVHAFPQFGIGIGGGGFGMGMRLPLNKNNGQQRSHNIERQVQRMKSDLKLSDDQTVKLRSLLMERDRRRDGSNPMASKEFNQRLQQLLTPEQFATLKEKRQQKHMQQQNPSKTDTIKQSSPPQKEDWDDVYH